MTISDGGEGYLTWRGVIVNRFSKNIDDVSGGFFFVTDENRENNNADVCSVLRKQGIQNDV